MPHAPIVIPIPVPVRPYKIPMVHWTFWSFTLTGQRSGNPEDKDPYVGEVIFGVPQIVIGGNAPPVADLPAGILPAALDNTYIVGISVANLKLFGCDGTNVYSQSAFGGRPNIDPITSMGSGNYKTTSMTLKNGTATLGSLAVVLASANNPTAVVLTNGQGPAGGTSLYFNFQAQCAGTWTFYDTWDVSLNLEEAFTNPYSHATPPLVPSPFPPGGIFIPNPQLGAR
jgi:hypothetical protein